MAQPSSGGQHRVPHAPAAATSPDPAAASETPAPAPKRSPASTERTAGPGARVCKWYLQGACHFGSECRNVHPDGAAGAAATTSSRPFTRRPSAGGANARRGSGASSGSGGSGGSNGSHGSRRVRAGARAARGGGSGAGHNSPTSGGGPNAPVVTDTAGEATHAAPDGDTRGVRAPAPRTAAREPTLDELLPDRLSNLVIQSETPTRTASAPPAEYIQGTKKPIYLPARTTAPFGGVPNTQTDRPPRGPMAPRPVGAASVASPPAAEGPGVSTGAEAEDPSAPERTPEASVGAQSPGRSDPATASAPAVAAARPPFPSSMPPPPVAAGGRSPPRPPASTGVPRAARPPVLGGLQGGQPRGMPMRPFAPPRYGMPPPAMPQQLPPPTMDGPYGMHGAGYPHPSTMGAHGHHPAVHMMPRMPPPQQPQMPDLREHLPPPLELPALPQEVPIFCVDVECVATGRQHHERSIAQIGVVDGIGRFVLNVIVRPEKEVLSYLTPLTGLTKEKVDQYGIPEATALQYLRDVLSPDCVIVGMNVRKDIEWLGLEQDRDFRLLIDLSDLFRVWNPRYRSFTYFSLDHVMKTWLNLNRDGANHDAIEDAYFSIALFNMYRNMQFSNATALIHELQWRTLNTEVSPSFAKQNPTFEGCCMGNRKTCTCGAPFFS